MPRVTKKQKEAGVKPKAKKGFQVGPARAGKDAYLGKAKKLKADLILRAKVKKQFAKVLKEEGLESTRLGDGSKRRGEREVPQPVAGPSSSLSRGRATVEKEEEGEEGGSDREEEDDGGESDASSVLDVERYAPATKERDRKGKSKALPREPRSSDTYLTSNPSSSRAKPKPAAPKTKALSPEPPTKPITTPSTTTTTTTDDPPKPSIRELKKEAFGKYHRAKVLPGVNRQCGGRGFTSTGAGAVGKRGQPNMGARMGVLLEQIRRDKA